MAGVAMDSWREGTRLLLIAVLSATAFGCRESQDQAPASGPPPSPTPPAAATATRATGERRPVAKVDAPVHDFGTTWAGPTLQHTFSIANAGDAPLAILGVEPDCGCTKAGTFPTRIEPGQSAPFPFSLNTAAVHGKYDKKIKVRTNAPETPLLTLSLRGECKRPVDVLPESVAFVPLLGETPVTRTVKVRSDSVPTFHAALTAQPAGGKFRAELAETAAGREYELRITALPPFATGNYNARAELTTNVPQNERINVPIYARVPDRLDVTPPVINLYPPADPGRAPPAQRLIVFQNYGNTDVRLVRVEADDPRILVSVDTQQPARKYTVRVQFLEGFDPPREGRTLILRTDDAEKPEIRVPIRRLETQPTPPAATPPTTKPSPTALLDRPAPRISAKTVAGRSVANEDFQNHPATVLNFVAADCPACKSQIPIVEAIRRDFESRGVRFVNVCQKRAAAFSDAQVVEFMAQLGARSELVHDPTSRTGLPFQIASTPTLFLIDRGGTVRQVIVGYRRANDLRVSLVELLGKPAP